MFHWLVPLIAMPTCLINSHMYPITVSGTCELVDHVYGYPMRSSSVVEQGIDEITHNHQSMVAVDGKLRRLCPGLHPGRHNVATSSGKIDKTIVKTIIKTKVK